MTTKKIYGDWIKWGGNECPVSPDTLVKIKMRDGVVLGPAYAASFLWRQGHGTGDIVEYCTAAHTDIDAAEQLLRGNGYTVISPLTLLTFEDVVPILRIKPTTVNIGGVELEVPLREAPEKGTRLWLLFDRTRTPDVPISFFWQLPDHNRWLNERRLFASKEARDRYQDALVKLANGETK